MKRIALAVFACLIFASTAMAQPGPSPWSPFGPGGGSVSSVAVDTRGTPLTLYAATVIVYKSIDGGMTWKAVLGPSFSAVAVDPDHPDTVFAGGHTVMRSTNGGRTWRNTLPPGQNLDQGVRILTVAPGGLVFAGTYNRLLRSADGGETWSETLIGLLELRSVQVDPSDPSRVYAANSETVYVSTDAGVHWQSMPRPGTGTLGRLALAPSAPRTLFISVTDSPATAIFRSDDGAATWREVGEIRSTQTAGEALLVHPRSASKVYAAGLSGLFASADGGETWTESNLGLPRPGHEPLGILSLATASPSFPDFFFAGTFEWGVAQSYSAGARWRIGFQPGLDAAVVQMLAFHPQRPGTVYVGVAGGVYGALGARSYRSTDSGRTWLPFARSISQDGLNSLAFDRTRPNVLYAATPGGTWKSADGGERWARVSDEAGRYIATAGRQALLSSRCGMKRSTDGGVTWQEVIPCLDAQGDGRQPTSLSVDPKDPNTAYVRFFVANGASRLGFEVYKSQDGGATWKRLRVPEKLSLFAVAPSDFRVLYSVSSTSLWRSVDGGETWKAVNRHIPPLVDTLFGTIAVDGADPYQVYLGALNGLRISHNGGRSFELVDAPLEASRKETTRLWTDRTLPGHVFTSPVYGNGLFIGRFE